MSWRPGFSPASVSNSIPGDSMRIHSAGDSTPKVSARAIARMVLIIPRIAVDIRQQSGYADVDIRHYGSPSRYSRSPDPPGAPKRAHARLGDLGTLAADL